MKIDRTRSYSDKGQIGFITRDISITCRWVMLILLIIVLAACNRPQRASSGAVGGANSTGTPGTPIPGGDAGGATLNLERNRITHDPNGTDTQGEKGTIPLVFSTTTEGELIVEGSGKIVWSEKAEFPVCYFTAKADGTVFIRGLFTMADCKFHLTIETKYSQPTTSNQSPDCTTSIQFSETEFSSQVELDPFSGRFNDSITNAWWETSSVTLTDLKSDQVTNCFVPEVIKRSTATP